MGTSRGQRIGTQIVRAIHKGVEGAESENLYYKFVEMNKKASVRKPSGSGAKTLWTLQGGGPPRTSECTSQEPNF